MKSLQKNSIADEMRGRKMTHPESTIHTLFKAQTEIYPNSIALEFKDKYVTNSEIKTPLNYTIVDLFSQQAEKSPNEIAVVYKEQQLTYNELNILSNQLAHYLIIEKDLILGDLVGIMQSRSEMLIVCILGILKSGAAYVPIDPEYPQQRISYLKKDCNCKFTLDYDSLNKFLISKEKYAVTAPTTIFLKPNDLAYIIYTSGSTGNPKGVMIEHRNLLHYLFNVCDYIDTNSRNSGCYIHLSSSFDASISGIFLPLIFGKKLILSSKTGLEIFDDTNLFKYAPYDFINLTPSHINILISVINKEPKPKLATKYVIGGAALYNYHINQFRSANIDAIIVNEYGPTEATVGCSWYEFNTLDAPLASESIPIGKLISNTQIYVLDENRQLSPTDEVGEIYISGNGIARGYFNREELNLEKFLLNPFDAHSRMYRTGDMGKWSQDGTLQYLGRSDDQVKINGHRIELGEIEAALIKIPQIRLASVILSKLDNAEPRLVAYLQPTDNSGKHPNVREELSKIVPSFMIPNIFIWVDDFPLTTNGKIDKKSLPTPEYVRPDSAPLLRKPKTLIEKEIAKVWIEELKLPIVGIDDNFYEMGGTSFLTQRVVTILRKSLSEKISVATIYQYPTIATLSEYLALHNKSFKVIDYSKRKDKKSSRDVAIIGMSGRFPGASSIVELWDVLKEGKETISFFESNEIDASIPESIRKNPLYVSARGIIPTANTFDAAFFGINPKLATVMDPQQRLFLEISWEALEQAGYLPKHFTGRIGVYAGVGTNTYYKKNILPNAEILEDVGELHSETVNDKDYISTRTSYHLNLKGPAVSIHSACSTSLLAIAEAVQSIRNGQCDIALAGASSITAPINSGHLYEEGSMLSSDGHCCAFDASSTGTVFSDGAGVVILKSLDSAVNDGDEIYGIIKGVGITNDGGNKGSFTAPSAQGQADAISAAIIDAKVTPDSISYVETHGTATPIGDPIEIEGLKIAYGKQAKKGYCAIGSIKTNIGHLTAAAGVAGLIKTILAMNNKLLPASLGFDKPNPAIDFENSPFFVNAKLRPWDSDVPLKAGVSSFGVGGTNVHIILEEYPAQKKVSSASRPLQLLMWSAKSENSLKGYAIELGKFIQSQPKVSLADIAYSLNKTRDTFAHRSFLLSSNANLADQELLFNEKNTIKTSELKVAPNEIVFLFPGQGSQFSQMGIHLYKSEKVYKAAVDRCAEILSEKLKLDIRTILYPEIVTLETEAKLKDTRFTQPALFVTEYALSQLWLSWGIKPTAFCGHSIGEFVAAHLAGIFTLQDALHLIAIRGRLVSELPKGSMLSVKIAEDKLKNILPETLSIAAVNSNAMCVVSGADQMVREFAKSLEKMEIANKLLFTSHAFHSTMMNPILDLFEGEVKKINLSKPILPIASTVTGTWLLDDEAIDPKYWSNHLRNTVRFADATNTLLTLEDSIFLEVGPGLTLTTLTKQQGIGKIIPAYTSLLLPKNQETEYHSILSTLGELWLQGIDIDWNSFYSEQHRLKVDLPSYVFDRKPCWIEPVNAVQKTVATALSSVSDLPLVTTNTDKNSFKTNDSRKEVLFHKISKIIENVSGIFYEFDSASTTFLELGLDSLSLTQLAGNLKKEFYLPITFRQLNEALSSPSLLADFIITNSFHDKEINITTEERSITDTNQSKFALTNVQNTLRNSRTIEEVAEHQKPFGAAPRIEKKVNEMSASQKDFLNELIISYTQKTGASKTYTQKNRGIMADPRVVSGFKPLTKEIVYPIVIEKSSGNRLWDIDGNMYIDALNGFGSCLFGHQPDFIKEALHKQLDAGFEVGPQHPLAGEVCELLCEFTKHERAALCNTGSEAVLGAMRIARTVTGKSLIVAFSGSYHGIVDEALVRGSKKLVSYPASAGIMPEAVQNMLILEYGTEESIRIISERANEIAAVLVEPVQSRRPEFQPISFLKKLRDLTTQSDVVLIFDEVITGFRMHPGGIQALFNIQADIATYGKVIGGGISIGAILGKRQYLDALDGGDWQYGDDSVPEVGVTYFAGTFVRHPLALASCKASLIRLKEQGPGLQERLNKMTSRLASELNDEFKKKDLPMIINHFGSLWRLKFNDDVLYGELLFTLLRENGIHIWDGFPCFLTEAYKEEDVVQLINTLKNCLHKMVSAGFFMTNKSTSLVSKQAYDNNSLSFITPPIDGARLGRDEDGNPAWYIEDSSKNGEYIKINL